MRVFAVVLATYADILRVCIASLMKKLMSIHSNLIMAQRSACISFDSYLVLGVKVHHFYAMYMSVVCSVCLGTELLISGPVLAKWLL